jgi:D-alanine-D-alanine ligase-like ATP-grasp enzyme
LKDCHQATLNIYPIVVNALEASALALVAVVARLLAVLPLAVALLEAYHREDVHQEVVVVEQHLVVDSNQVPNTMDHKSASYNTLNR